MLSCNGLHFDLGCRQHHRTLPHDRATAGVQVRGIKRLHHPVVGDLSLTYEALDLAADAGLRICAYAAEPGSATEDGLKLLAGWAATLDRAEISKTAGEA